MVTDQTIGLLLAISSSVFIGSSFILKKRGLRLAGSSGLRAGEQVLKQFAPLPLHQILQAIPGKCLLPHRKPDHLSKSACALIHLDRGKAVLNLSQSCEYVDTYIVSSVNSGAHPNHCWHLPGNVSFAPSSLIYDQIPLEGFEIEKSAT